MGISLAMLEVTAAAVIGESFTPWSNANARLGVGNGTAPFVTTQTDLQGASKLRKAVSVGYPTRSGRILTWQAMFMGDEANFAWAEYGVFNAASAGTMFCRELEDHGTKAADSVWVLTLAGTLAT